MTGKRRKVQDFLLTEMKKVDKSGYNYNFYKKFFASLTDKDFHVMMEKVLGGEELPIFVNEKTNITIENNLKVGKNLDIKFFQKVREKGPDGTWYLTPVEYMVYWLPLRRTAQTAVKSVSTPENNLRRNNLTGQVTGSSKVTRMTLQEAQVMMGTGFTETLKEFYKLRGGDAEAMNIMVNRIVNNGSVDGRDVVPFTDGPQSTITLKNFFKSAYLIMK